MDQVTKQRRLMGALVIALMLLVLVMLGIMLRQAFQTNELLLRSIQQNTITEQWRNELGQQVTLANSNYLTTQELLHSTDSTIKLLRDDLGKMAKSVNKVTYLYTTLSQQVRTGVRDTLVMLPSGEAVTLRTFSYSDPWVPSMKGVLTGDSLTLDYSLKSDFRLSERWKKTGLFKKPRELELEIVSLNPNVTVNRVQQFTVIQPKEKVPRWVQNLTLFGLGTITGLLVE